MHTVYDCGDILAGIKREAPEAHIAGGAVRDTILEREIHDIDVFLHRDNKDRAAALLRRELGYVKVGEWQQFYEEFSDAAIDCVAKFEKADQTIPVCLIALKKAFTEQENMSRFDFGICMAAWTGGDAKPILMREFEDDRKEKKFTLHRADNKAQLAYSMTRCKKLTATRYQGWNIAIPDHFEGMLKEHTFRTDWYHDGDYKYCMKDSVLRPKTRLLVPETILAANGNGATARA
jgi:Poly A polymerase head domain